METKFLNQLAKMVHEFCGINYLNNLSSFEIKIKRRLTKLNVNSVEKYIDYLQNNPSEWNELIQVVTINETYFFRENRQLYIYQQKILPKLVNRPTEPIRIWSAACSTGEEAYTIAMLTNDIGIRANHNLKIIASDINSRVLKVAQEGVYNKSSLSFRRILPYWIKSYFEAVDSSYLVKENIKRFVEFKYMNLKNSQLILQQEPYDVIFCRNVLIYFDEETIEKIIRDFYTLLKPGGYLFLGHAETITHFKEIGFETINDDGTFYYRKG